MCWLTLLFPLRASAQNTSPEWLPVEREADSSDPGFARLVNPAFPSPETRTVPIDRGPKVERADLAAYFAEGVLREAKVAFDSGRYATVKEKLSKVPDSPPVRFLRALSAYRGLESDLAGKSFEALAQDYAPLRDRCLVYAGWAYESARDWQGARRAFAAVASNSRLLSDAKLGTARALAKLKDFKAAAAALDALVDRPAPPWGRDLGAEALMALADIQLARIDAKAEKKALLALWSKHPLTAQAARAEARIGALSAVPDEVVVTRAEVLIDAHRNLQGITMLEPLLTRLKVPDAVACRAHFAVGKGYRKQRLHAKAAAVLGPVTKKCSDADIRARALYTLGFSQTIVAPALAAETYRTLARDYPDHSFADDGLFFAADSFLREGRLDEGVSSLIELVNRYPTADFAAEALFKLFWVARLESQLGDANDYLTEIEHRWASAEDTGELERAGYWRARVAEAQERKDDAVALYAEIARQHPASYYGLISREKVETLDPKLGESLRSETVASATAADSFPIFAGPVAKDPQFQSAVELLRLGLT